MFPPTYASFLTSRRMAKRNDFEIRTYGENRSPMHALGTARFMAMGVEVYK